MTTQAPGGMEMLPSTGAAERKLAQEVNEEYHDPLDDWSARDVLLSLVPFIVTFAFKDTNLYAAASFGIAWAGVLLILRTVAWDSKRKHIWPILDITSLITFAVLRGVLKRGPYHLHKWWPVVVPSIFAFVGILTLLWRRPFTAHYARYPKFDRGGRGVWTGDASYRRTNDLATLSWIAAWCVMLFLSLIPILVGHWFTFHALNTIFNYIVPFVLLTVALVAQQVIGAWYRTTASRTAATAAGPGMPGYTERGTLPPSGAEQMPGTTGTTGGPTTYSSTAV